MMSWIDNLFAWLARQHHHLTTKGFTVWLLAWVVVGLLFLLDRLSKKRERR